MNKYFKKIKKQTNLIKSLLRSRSASNGMTHSMFTQCHSEYSRGMTYVELIVVLSIFFVLSSVVMFNYRDFQDRIDIKNLASDITLKIIEAQKSSLNGVWNFSAVPDWRPSYGIYFNPSTVSDFDGPLNKKFIYFADLDNGGFYDGLPTCTTSECLDKIIITKNNYISRIDSYIGSNLTQEIANPLSVIFKRPDSSAIFVSSGLSPGFDYIQITVASARGATALIKLYPSGRAQIN